ncbi:MAG: ABC transporter substrate-binding protein [Chloroflexi bacterium]|nr:ABC transporter substrate-binding protein [Chloroflexota bacterium]
MNIRFLGPIIALTFVVAACSPSSGPAAPTATSVPATAAKPAATAPAAAPAAPAASPAASPAAPAPPAASPAVAGSAAKPSANLTGEIPLGAIWSLTGGAAVYGAVQKNATEMAVDEINKSGTLGAAKIKLITEDDRSVKEGAIPAMEKLTGQDKVVVVLGPTLSNSAKAADPVAQDRKVVVVAVSNTADGIVEMGDYVFRVSLPESAVVPNTVSVTKNKIGYTKVAVMYGDDDAFTKAGYDVFKSSLEKNSVQILTTETFKKGDTDFSAQLTKIKAQGPQALIVSALAEEAAGIMVQARQLGITVPIIGGNGFNSPQLAKLAGPAAEGAISGAAWFISADAPGNAAFVKAYRERYNSDPDQFAAQAYAGTNLIVTAIRNAGATDSKSIRDALAKLKDQDTVLGKFSFSDQRDAIHTPVVQVVKNGKFELYK